MSLLVRYHTTGDRRARAAAIERSMVLVHSVARRFKDRGIDHDELVQVGSIGLIKAVDRFDPGLGYAFSTFAVPNITGEIRRHFRDHGWSVRVTRRIQEAAALVAKVTVDLTTSLQRTPSIKEVSARSGLSIDQVLEALEGSRHYTSRSLDAPRDSTDSVDGDSWHDSVGADDGGFVRAEARVMAIEGMRVLQGRARQIVAMRFGKDMTQLEIAEHLGISQMHVSRLLRQALDDVRDELERPGGVRAV